jgi:hypothetical protein
LSAFTHLWNPAGFPSLHTDEGYYLGRAMRLLHGFGPQEFSFYDHPYFGQLFLAGILRLVGYPDFLYNPTSGDDGNVIYSIAMLYSIPRTLMGILSVADTFFVYKITERRYKSYKIALIASVLFAIMPATWFTRRILLDSILLPFLLLSILLALYTTGLKENRRKNISLILLSGLCLGLAIFTKIPVFTMIPLIGFIVYRNSNNNNNNGKDFKMLGLWFIPVILIPLIWPAYAVSVGEFDNWWDGVIEQTQRKSKPLFDSLIAFFKIDPVLGVLGMSGIVFTIVRKDIFALLWAIPFLFFLYLIGWVQVFHLIVLLPIFCISSSNMILEVSNKIRNKKGWKKLLPFAITFVIGLFGLLSTTMLITTNLNFPYFDAITFIVDHLPDINNNNNKNGTDNSDRVTVISNPVYLWIPQYIFDKNHEFKSYDNKIPIATEKILLIVDEGFKNIMSRNDRHAEQLRSIYNDTTNTIFVFFGKIDYPEVHGYPYSNSITESPVPEIIEIKTNYASNN